MYHTNTQTIRCNENVWVHSANYPDSNEITATPIIEVTYPQENLHSVKSAIALAEMTMKNRSNAMIFIRPKDCTSSLQVEQGWEIPASDESIHNDGLDAAMKAVESTTGLRIENRTPIGWLPIDHTNTDETQRTALLHTSVAYTQPVSKGSMERKPINRADTMRLYLRGRMRDIHVLGILYADRLRRLQQETSTWNPNVERSTAIILEGVCHQTSAEVASLLVGTQTPPGANTADRNEMFYVSRDKNGERVFGLRKTERHCIIPTINTNSAAPGMPDNKFSAYKTTSFETFTGEIPQNQSGQKNVIVNNLSQPLQIMPYNQDALCRITSAHIVNRSIAEIPQNDIEWLTENDLAKAVEQGQISLLTLAAIQGYKYDHSDGR